MDKTGNSLVFYLNARNSVITLQALPARQVTVPNIVKHAAANRAADSGF